MSRVLLVWLWIWGGWSLALLVMGFSRIYASDGGRTVFLAVLYAWAGLVPVALLILGYGFFILRQERIKGRYTAQPLSNATQIDSRTGVVIREAGDPLLSPAEYKIRLQEAREWANTNPR